MVGVVIGQKWHLPVDILNAIMLHHNPKCERINNDRVRAMVAMVKIANAMVAEFPLALIAVKRWQTMNTMDQLS